jgi:hypothetical protein
MRSWAKGMVNNTKVDCIITFEVKQLDKLKFNVQFFLFDV